MPLSYDLTTFQILGQNLSNFCVGILVQRLTPKGHFEINWPLIVGPELPKLHTDKKKELHTWRSDEGLIGQSGDVAATVLSGSDKKNPPKMQWSSVSDPRTICSDPPLVKSTWRQRSSPWRQSVDGWGEGGHLNLFIFICLFSYISNYLGGSL